MISIIAAIGEKNEMGYLGDMPWGRNLPNDLLYFKKVTEGQIVVMGRKTYESIGKPLKNRKNIILTSNKDYKVDGCDIVHHIDEVLELSKGEKEVFIIGGAEVYSLFLPMVDKLYLTRVKENFSADTYFPVFDESAYELTVWIKGKKDEKNKHEHGFFVYEKKIRG